MLALAEAARCCISPLKSSGKRWKPICSDLSELPRHLRRCWGPTVRAWASREGSFKSAPSGASLLSLFSGHVASKFALEGMSESLRRELLLYGIDVIIVGPGAVKTPIFDKAQQLGSVTLYGDGLWAILKGFVEYFLNEGKKGLAASRIGEAVYKALTVRKPRVRYAVVPERLKNWTLPRALPTRTLDRMIGKQSGLLR